MFNPEGSDFSSDGCIQRGASTSGARILFDESCGSILGADVSSLDFIHIGGSLASVVLSNGLFTVSRSFFANNGSSLGRRRPGEGVISLLAYIGSSLGRKRPGDGSISLLVGICSSLGRKRAGDG